MDRPIAPSSGTNDTSDPGVGQGDQTGHVLLCGFGRVGSTIGLALEHFAIPYTVIERDPDIVRQLRRRGISCLYRDAAQVIVALPLIHEATLTIRRLRILNDTVPLLARAHGSGEARNSAERHDLGG